MTRQQLATRAHGLRRLAVSLPVEVWIVVALSSAKRSAARP